MTRLVWTALFAALATSALGAEKPWIGRWSIDPAGCQSYGDTRRTAPLEVAEKSLRWHDITCTIGKIYRIGDSAHIQAHCSGRTATTPISLNPKKDRLAVFWDNEKIEEMRRCR